MCIIEYGWRLAHSMDDDSLLCQPVGKFIVNSSFKYISSMGKHAFKLKNICTFVDPKNNHKQNKSAQWRFYNIGANLTISK